MIRIRITPQILIPLILFAHASYAQFGNPILIDSTTPNNTLLVRLKTADINGDGRPDVIRGTGNINGNGISYYLNNGNQSFSAANVVTGPFSYISDIALDDYNGDGKPDLLVLDKQAPAMYLYLNAGGTFPTRTTITSPRFTKGHPNVVLSGDFTGDGRPDLLVKDHFDVLLFKGIGNGTFDTARSMIPEAMQTELYHLVAGNFNQDGFPDFAVSTSGFMTFLNDGTGHFNHAGNTGGTICFLLAPGDLNGDGVDDMLMRDNKTHILLNNGTGTFTAAGLLKPANYPYRAFDIADLDGDGDKDVYAVYDQINRAVWFKNNGSGTLDTQSVIYQETRGGFYAGCTADMNGDSRPDVLWANVNGRIGLHLNVQVPSGILSSASGANIHVYPNPVAENLWVETPMSAMLTTTDVLGKQVDRRMVAPGRQQISFSYPEGIYFLQFTFAGGTGVIKLVKKTN